MEAVMITETSIFFALIGLAFFAFWATYKIGTLVGRSQGQVQKIVGVQIDQK